MIPKGATIEYGDCIEVYRGHGGCLVVYYRRPTYGPEWPSMSYWMIFALTSAERDESSAPTLAEKP